MAERSGFDPMAVTESNATSYPQPYRAQNQKRWNRRLGERTAGDEIIYPDIDMRARMEPAGGYRYFHKNGTAF